MSINFLEFPYKKNSLEPVISNETISFHYEKHHRAYYNNLEQAVKGTKFQDMKLEQIILDSYNNKDLIFLYNNSAQVFNHDFYWKSLAFDSEPSDFALSEIKKSFISIDKFKQELKEKALRQFGSGWVWLVLDQDKKLKIISTSNSDNPLIFKYYPIMTIDVWEHAYYIDYRNDRGKYLSAVIDNLLNWKFIESNIKNIIVD